MPLKPSPIQIRKGNGVSESAFLTWHDDKSKLEAFKEMGRTLNKVEGVYYSKGALGNQYQGIDVNTSIRSPFTRMDYEYFRPTEQIPRLQKAIIGSCMNAYDKIGIIKFVIDMMADFACQGIRLTHRDRATEDFYKQWWQQINGSERSERFLNMLYRSGNVVVKRSTAILNEDMVRRWKRAVADTTVPANPSVLGYPEAPGTEFTPQTPDLNPTEPFKPGPLEVPWRYTILNPLTLSMQGEELAAFSGDPFYTIQLPVKVFNMINNPQSAVQKSLVDSIPADIVNQARKGKREVGLDPDKIITMYYKKDDWMVWANPMLYSILDDLILLEKMKLADLTALDGAIHHIRIWKLGNLEHRILPNDAIIQKLADLLLNNVGGGAMDLLWGPDIELSETSTEVHKFLGAAKYESVLTSICAGLGVPLSIAGASDKGSYTNNFISLKTLIERLTYGRNVLTAMWKKEIAIVQKAMNFRYPAQILYDNMNLSDDASEKMLWIQLWDRNLISDETVQEKFGQIPDVESSRIQREFQMRKDETMPPKASPYTDANPDVSYKKIALQRGLIGPKDLGIEGSPVMEMMGAPKGQPGQGRPLTSKDKAKRKKRTVKPSAKAEEFFDMSTWANLAQKEISDIVTPIYIEKVGKSDLRGLTTVEAKELENYKFLLLCNLEAFDEVVPEVLYSDVNVYKDLESVRDEFVVKFSNIHSRIPSPLELRNIQSYAYALYNADSFEEE